jgi:hypothetical protein
MSRLPQGLNAQYLSQFQIFFEKVQNKTLESKELAEFTRLVLGGIAITSRNQVTQHTYLKKKAGEQTWRAFTGVYGTALYEQGATTGFLEINNSMGSSKPDTIAKKCAKIVRDAKNWETSWKKQSTTGWYARISADELATYTLKEKISAEKQVSLFGNFALINKVISFRRNWQPTFDALTYAKKEMKIWNRQRREAKKAAKPPMVGGVQMPVEYHLLTQETITEITDLLNDGIMPQYEQWKVDEFDRVSLMIENFNTLNTGKVWTEEEMFTKQRYRVPICNISKVYFTYCEITPSQHWASTTRTWTYEGLKDDWKADLKKNVQDTAEEMRLQFIGYMMEKLLPVVAMKDSTMVDATNYVDRAPRFGQYVRFNFAFEDGSSFDLEGCVEQSYSSRGLPFFRFPRRFYNVVLSTGQKLKNGKMTPFKTMVQVFCQQ